MLRAVGYINAADDFTGHALVLNGFSDLVVELWGDAGRHARWGRVLRDNTLGPERAAGLHRLNTAVKCGLRMSVHSDYNVTPIHPLLAARTSVLRQTQDGGEVLGPNECVDPDTALRAITADAAWQIHADDRGTLEVGKLADFAVVSETPWTAHPATSGDVAVWETRLGGSLAWRA
ncbi:MAG TPA: amidohydrolase family protein [Solirubrobacteraceae bacterium]